MIKSMQHRIFWSQCSDFAKSQSDVVEVSNYEVPIRLLKFFNKILQQYFELKILHYDNLNVILNRC